MDITFIPMRTLTEKDHLKNFSQTEIIVNKLKLEIGLFHSLNI